MKFIIKAQPDDFRVEEIADLPLEKTGEYGVFRLTKSGWNTVDVLKSLSKTLKIPFGDLAYGGKKDRHALTRQFITIKSARVSGIIEKSFSLEYVGRMRHPMAPRYIQGNDFSIIVRKLGVEAAQRAVEEMFGAASAGYPNYFDDQRFGSYDTEQGFLGEKALKKHFSGALKIYLTKVQTFDAGPDRERKRFFFEQWGQWRECLEKAGTAYEKKVFEHLRAHPKGFLEVLRRIPHEELTVYFSAYQSFLWNEMLRQVLTSVYGGPLKKYPGMAGDYIFPAGWESSAYLYLADCSIPLPGTKVELRDELLRRMCARVMASRDIKQGMFNSLSLRQAFFKSLPRAALVKPERVEHQISDDETHPGMKKLALSFSLPRGSYATMFLKRIFAD